MANGLVDLTGLNAAQLRRVFIGRDVPRQELFRQYFGRATDMNTIESALRAATQGNMAMLCDLETEVMGLDPHLSSVLSKRFGAIAAADWDLTSAVVEEKSDKAFAERIAQETRAALSAISCLSDRLYDLAWGLYDGRSALEIHWGTAAGVGRGELKWRPEYLSWIHPRYLNFGAARDLRYVDPMRWTQFSSTVGLPLDGAPGKFMAWLPRLFREFPEREGLGPRCLYWSFFKRFSWRHRMTLTELFGIPWRIVSVKDPAQPVNPEALETSKEAAERLGGETTAALDTNIQLDVEWPGENDGKLFSMTAEEVNAELSKLVLGNVGTTDPVANRAESVVQKGEQDILFQRDGAGLSAVVGEQLVRVIVAVNYGLEAAGRLCPKFQIRTAPPRDRKSELERVEKVVVALGVPVAATDVYEISGLRKPMPDEPILQAGVAGVDAIGNPTAGRVSIFDPAAKPETEPNETAEGAPSAGSVQLTPSDLAAIVTVNEARASVGLPPLTGPDGDLTLPEFKAKHAGVIAQAAAAEGGKTKPSDPDAAPPPFGAPGPEQKKPVPATEPDAPTAEDAGTDGAAKAAEDDVEATRVQYVTLPTNYEKRIDAALDTPEDTSFAERNAAFLADLKDMRAAKLVVSQDDVNELAAKHGVPTRKLEP